MILVYNLNKEKVEGLYIQAYSIKTRQIQETSIDKIGEYRLRGLVPGHDYELRVKIPSNSSNKIVNSQLSKKLYLLAFR